MSGVHVIRKQIFQFELEEAAQYRMLAEKIRLLGDRILPEALDKVLSEFVSDDVHLVIDKLELDIGVLRPEDLADQLIPRILAALRLSLRALRKEQPSKGVARVEEGPARQAAILRHFVVHGRLPWWAGSKNISIRNLSGALILTNPESIGQILAEVSKDGPRLRRLLQHLDLDVLIEGWMRTRPDSGTTAISEITEMMTGVVHQLQTSMGRDAAIETVRLHLLKSILGNYIHPDVGARPVMPASSYASQIGLSAQKMPVPLRAFFHRYEGARAVGSVIEPKKQASPQLPGGQNIMARSGPTTARDRRKAERVGLAADQETDIELEAFGGYLQEGRLQPQRARSMSVEVVQIFTTLIAQRLPELSGMIRDLGRAERVRRRILDSIPSPRLRSFFEAAVPGKREAIEWVESVYIETQRKVRPINQTNIRVQRSVDEITLELFTTTDLNAMGNAAFLRLHIRRMALKHHIRYRDLIRAIWRSSSLFDVSPDGRLYQILKALYEEAFPSAPGRSSGAEKPGLTEGTIEKYDDQEPNLDRSGRYSVTHDREFISGQSITDAERRFIADETSKAYDSKDGEVRSIETRDDATDYRSRITEKIPGTLDGMRPESGTQRIDINKPGRADHDHSIGSADSTAAQHREGRTVDEGTIIYSEPGGINADEKSAFPAEAQSSNTRDERTVAPVASGARVSDGLPGGLPDAVSGTPSAPIGTDRPGGATSRPGGATSHPGASAGHPGGATGHPDASTGHPGASSKEPALQASGSSGEDGLQPQATAYTSRADISSTAGKPEGSSVPESSGKPVLPTSVNPEAGHPYSVVRGSSAGDDKSSPGGTSGLDITRGDKLGEGSRESGGIRTPLDLLEPVPADLLDILPRAVVRALILIKGTQIFGRHTRALQELISTYIRLSAPPQIPLESVDVPALLKGLSDYLGVEPEFLLFAFRYSAGVHPADAQALAVSSQFTLGEPPLIILPQASMEAAAGGSIALVNHLSAYRWYYEASHVKTLLLPMLRAQKISGELFSSLIRLLYDDQADRVAQEWARVTSSSITTVITRDPAALLDEARHAFVEATLAGNAMPFSLPRIFARIRRILQPEQTGPAPLPAGLADVSGYFSPAPVAQGAAGGRKAAIRREHSILRLYHILNLDLVLQGVGDRFFDNIPFSFELLLSKYRGKLLEILHDHRFDAELAQFFAYADPSGIFEQIRRILPATQTDRITRTFRQAVEILHRSRWLTLGRNELTAFAGLDAYPYYLSPDLDPPALSEVVYEIMRRAWLSGSLSARFKETLAVATDEQWLTQVARSIGVRRRDQIFPLLTAGVGILERTGVSRYRSLLVSVGSLSVDDTAALTLRAILDTGRFPEGHVLRAADPESHPDYLKRLAGIGQTIEQVFKEPGEGYGLMMSGLLDRAQLIRAVAARYGLRRDQVRMLTQAWFDRSAGDGWMLEDFLEALLQSPVSSTRAPGRQAFNRAALKLLRRSDRISWWDMLVDLQSPRRSSDRSLDGLKTADVTPFIRGGREDWMELYFGLTQSPPSFSGVIQRVLAVWMRGISIKPAFGTRRQRFRSLVESMLSAFTAETPDTDQLHRAWLDAQAFFEGLKPTSVRNVFERLVRAGIPAAVLMEHLRSKDIDLPTDETSEKPAAKHPDMSFEDSLLRGMITPEALAALWRPGSRDAAQILSALKNWVSGRYWNVRSAERLAKALPPQAMSALLLRLSPVVDLRRIIESWSVFLQRAGIYPDRQKSASAILRVVLTHRLWQHQTPRRLQVELFQWMGLMEAMHRGVIQGAVLAEGIDGVPPVFLRMAADLLSTRSRITTDELLALWPVTWTESEVVGSRQPSERGRFRVGAATISPAVLDFLETGVMPALVGQETIGSVSRRLAAEISAVGPGGFLGLPSLHESVVLRALDFFRPEELSTYIFTRLMEKTTDAALRRYLEVFSDLARHRRVRRSELIRFLKLYRRFFTMAGGHAGQTETFLRAALVIPSFAQLTKRTLSAMPRNAWRATRSPFLQFIIRGQLKERGLRRPDIDALTVFFLRTGLLHPDAGPQELPVLYRRILEHLAAGDPDLRATIFLYAKDRMARRRIRELFEGMEEAGLYEWILPGLTDALKQLTDLLRIRFGIDIWRATGARSARDRQERVLAWWSQTRPIPGHVIQLLKGFMEQFTGVLDERQWQRIRHPDLSAFTAAERSLWNELRALLPELIEAPADSERRLAPPASADEGPRMNEPDTDSNPVDGITVQNGGLVILWPYLGRLFTRLGLSDGKTFTGDEEQSRAIRITEYLVTGSTEMEEHQLALNKLICGAAIEFQVPASIELTPEEEELCGKMLQGVIRNWEKMKTTRPNTFRETFLKREARLYKVEDRWELVVARKPYDMLLDSLPWNISMIQLSWMPERLVVHWK